MASPLGTDISGYRIASDVAKSQGQNKQKGKFNATVTPGPPRIDFQLFPATFKILICYPFGPLGLLHP